MTGISEDLATVLSAAGSEAFRECGQVCSDRVSARRPVINDIEARVQYLL
jgi:hypothetical protein